MWVPGRNPRVVMCLNPLRALLSYLKEAPVSMHPASRFWESSPACSGGEGAASVARASSALDELSCNSSAAMADSPEHVTATEGAC